MTHYQKSTNKNNNKADRTSRKLENEGNGSN